MSNEIPCFNCITYAICKTQIIDRVISSLNNIENYNNNNPQMRDTTNEIMFAYYNILFQKCQILHSYIRPETKRVQERDLEPLESDIPTICVILDDAFNIRKAVNAHMIKKELKYVK